VYSATSTAIDTLRIGSSPEEEATIPRYVERVLARGEERILRVLAALHRAWQVIQLIARSLPSRDVIFVGDNSFAMPDLLYLISVTPRVALITRLRLDAQL
jgi:hypothetical protein